MAIKTLNNPLTEKYLSFKELVFSEQFTWNSGETTKGIGNFSTLAYSHPILLRPTLEFPVSRSCSKYIESVILLLKEIFDYNEILVNYFLRIHVNQTYYSGGKLGCDPHVDHKFPHKNLLIYFNNAGGPTVVIDSETQIEEYFYPKEDVIITFEGEHYHYQPNISEKRTVLVATYI